MESHSRHRSVLVRLVSQPVFSPEYLGSTSAGNSSEVQSLAFGAVSDLVVRQEQFLKLTAIDHASGKVLSVPQEIDLGIPEIPNDRVSTNSWTVFFFDGPSEGLPGTPKLIP